MFSRAYDLFKESPRGVEVGVYRGANAEEVTHQWPALFLYLVDDFREDSNAFVEAIDRLHNKNVSWLRLDSITASLEFKDGELDFVYLDGDHTVEGVLADIEAWKSKVKPGGLLGGHDYANTTIAGVRQAVHQFITKNDLVLRAIGEDWWVENVRN